MTSSVCPFCQKLVDPELVVCQHCGKSMPAQRMSVRIVLIWLVLLALFIAVWFWAGGPVDV